MAIRYPGASHILGKDIIELVGLDKIRVPNNSSFNFQESFTYGLMLQPTGLLPILNYAILSKGEPEDPAAGKFSLESVDGCLRVWLHNANDTNSLVKQSNLPILNDKRIFQIVVKWDYTLKDLKMYKNGVEVPSTVVTGGTKHANEAAMGLIRNNTDDYIFGESTGKINAQMKIFHQYISPRAWSSSEIATLYSGIEYLGSYPTQGTILFSSSREGTFEIHSMKEDGTEQTRVTYSGWSLMFPKWSESGDYFSFRNYSTSSLTGINNPYYSPANQNQYPPNYASRVSPGTLVLISSPSSGGTHPLAYSVQIMETTQAKIYYAEYSSPTPAPNTSVSSVLSKPFPALGTASLFRSAGINSDYWGIPFFCFSFDNLYCFYIYKGYSSNSASCRLYRRTIAGGSELLIEGNTNTKEFYNVQCNRQSTKIAYSLQDINNFYQVWVRDLDGSNAQQLTFDSFNNYVSGFTADGTKVIFNAYNPTTLKYQIHLIDVTGFNNVNISRNNFNDYYGDSILLP